MSPPPLLLPDGLDGVMLRALGLEDDPDLPPGPAWLDPAHRRITPASPPPLAGEFQLAFPDREALALVPGRPLVMGILNATPDSFHDGDPGAGLEERVARGLDLARKGADLLDVGGESTRPGAPVVDAATERERVVPLIRELRAAGLELPISVDTTKAEVAGAALEAGADLVNDVSGLARDPGMAPLVVGAGCPVVLMHMRGTPATMKGLTDYGPWAPAGVARELRERLEAALGAGVARDRIVLDPGVGFAKDWRQSLELIRRLDVLRGLGYPVLVGASRKSLLKGAAGVAESRDRLPGSLALALEAAARGAALVRVHDVAETVQALRTRQAVHEGLEAPDLRPG